MVEKVLRVAIDIIAKVIMIFLMGTLLFGKLDLKGDRYHIQEKIYFTDVMPNIYIFLIVTALVMCFGFIYYKFRGSERRIRSLKTKLAVASVIVALVQAVVFYNIYYVAGNDVYNVYQGAQIFAVGGYDEFLNTAYYQLCPNNIMIYTIMIVVSKLCIYANIDAYVALVVLSVVGVDIAIYVMTLVIYKLTDSDGLTLIAYIIAVILVALSGWASVPYTDSLSILFPILTLYIFLHMRDKDINLGLKMLAVGIIPVMTYKLKALNIIILIAICCTLIIIDVKKIRKLDWLSGLVAILVLGLIYVGGNKLMEASIDYVPDKDVELSLEWYLLLGSNPNSMGQWSYEDYQLAVLDKLGYEERQKACYDVISSRYEEMGFTGLITHLNNKNQLFYNDPGFGYGLTRGSIRSFPERDSKLATFLRNVYYHSADYGLTAATDEYGLYYMPYIISMQFVWMAVLMGIGILILWRPKYKDIYYILLEITFIGLYLFTMLFEVSARLLYSYLPVLIVAMAMGLNLMRRKIRGK